MNTAGFALTETSAQLADGASLPFLYVPPGAAGGFAMPHFAYVALQKESNKMTPAPPPPPGGGGSGMTAV